MSETAAGPLTAGEISGLLIRDASVPDAPLLAAAISELLIELGGTPAPIPALQDAALAVIEDPGMGVLLVAESAGELVGLLAVSWQHAIRTAGRYGLIQELWVRPASRERKVGAAMLRALLDLARDEGVDRIEVGLPSERFAGLAETEEFYRRHGFTDIGMRMRWSL